MLLIAARYDWAIGGAGAVGAVLTGVGLLFADMGGGVAALVVIGAGTGLLVWRARGRLVGTVPAVILAVGTSSLIAAFMVFGVGNGQDVTSMWAAVPYGPGWIVFALALRAPAGSRPDVAPVAPAAMLPTGA